MTMMVQEVQQAQHPERYVPRTRNIYLCEVDALAQVLVGRGHVALAKRIRELVAEHERACIAKRHPRQPTVCRVAPAPRERQALTDALRVVRRTAVA